MELYRLKKKYAKTNIVFEENKDMDKDGWFIDIKAVNKSGDTKSCSTIIRSDIDSRLKSYIKNGWVKIEKDEK